MTSIYHDLHNGVMSDWRKRGKKQGDVVYFPYISEKTAALAEQVYLWDVDKTYLDTKFESLKGLWRTATEKAQSKKNIPGTAELVRCLSDFHKPHNSLETFPVFFITASPPQIENKIYQKLRIDGVEPYGIFCKDNLENLRPRKLWKITKHVGYKMQALLQMRVFLNEDVRLVMFGDDGETDAVIYNLFSDVCARRIESADIRRVLNHFSVLDNQVDYILRLQDLCPANDPVEKIYINLAEDTDADYYLKFGRRTVPTYNAFQTALDMVQDERLNPEHILRVAKKLTGDFEYSPEELEKSYEEMIRRGVLSLEACERLTPILIDGGVLAEDYSPSVTPKPISEKQGQTITKLEGSFDPWVPEHVDYTSEYR